MDAAGPSFEALRVTPAIVACAGLLTMLVCRPLIRGRVRPNRFYGIRTPAAFRSDEDWYRINRLGGLMMFRWGIFILLVGLAGLLLPGMMLIGYGLVAGALTVVSLLVTAVRIFRIE